MNSPTKTKNQQVQMDESSDREATILCSRKVSQEDILNGLTQVRNEEQVASVTMQDLVMSNHHRMLPLVKALAASSGRTWESFRFADTIKVDRFPAWQQLRNDMLQDYEQHSYDNEDSSDFLQVMTWQANVQIPRGAHVEDIVEFLEMVQDDDEVYQVSFGGSAVGDIDEVLIPDVLSKLVNHRTLRLTKDVVVQVDCGWMEDESNWVGLLDDSISSLYGLSGAPPYADSGIISELSIASMQSYTGTTEDTTTTAGNERSFHSLFHKSLNDSKTLEGNLSWKSNGTSFSGYPSFYDSAFFQTSLGDFGVISEGHEEDSHDSRGSLSATTAPDVPRVPKAA